MPDLGRWNGMDQLSELYHDTSPYAYVVNNPVRFTDPDGRCPQKPDGSYDCWTEIEEVVINGTPKPKNESILASPIEGWTLPFFPGISEFFSGSGSGSGGGSIGGGNGGGSDGDTKLSPWVQYRKDLEAYRLAQSRRAIYAAMGDPIDDLQAGLELVGNAPVAGELFDGINGLIYLGRGQNLNAVASFSAMVPLAGTGLKYGIKGLAKNVPTGKFYSVAYEMTLKSSSYPGVYRGGHFREANKALDAMLKSDVKFASSMAELGIVIPRSPAGSILGKSPTNWVWHHHVDTGVMQLVPKSQHTVKSPFWGTMYPGNRGGFSIWGK